ncbi:MAG: phospholipase D-like domain-containing protein [Eubacterium sp.]
MTLLLSNEIWPAVRTEIQRANKSIHIITAFCKLNSIIKINELVNSKVKDKKLLIRFRMEDIINGSTDFEVLEYCILEGWEVYIRFDLHAKTYLIDSKRVFVGSANLTQRGLTGIQTNSEMATLVDVESRDLDKINKLFTEAVRVTTSIMEIMKNEIGDVSDKKEFHTTSWSKEIIKLFNPKIETLFSHELPDKPQYNEGEYIPFLEINYNNIETVKDAFRKSNIYLWLVSILEKKKGMIYFGELSAELHNSMIEDPKPYRKDVKIFLSNLLSFIIDWEIVEIKVDKPNFSQRIQLIKR